MYFTGRSFRSCVCVFFVFFAFRYYCPRCRGGGLSRKREIMRNYYFHDKTTCVVNDPDSVGEYFFGEDGGCRSGNLAMFSYVDIL